MNMVKKYYRFIILLAFLFCSLVLLETTRSMTLKEHHEAMREAARRTESSFSAIRQERLSRGHQISWEDDPNGTGMVGESYTEITTTLGNLEAKRSTANPNTGAMIYDMLIQCGVQPEDTVAVNLSSSFPCLNIAVLCALDTLGVEGIIINSVGASTYGANLPDFTYLDMEHLLLSQGLIQNHSRWFSMGGAGDLGKEMPDDIKDTIIQRLTGYGLIWLSYEDIQENVAFRHQLYLSKGSPSCFINVGGNLLSFGGGEEMISANNGLLLPNNHSIRNTSRPQGLVPLFLQNGTPVIHLLNMKSLLPAWGLPFDPSPMPDPGQGDVYYQQEYNRTLAAVCLGISLLLLYWAVSRLPRRKIPL